MLPGVMLGVPLLEEMMTAVSDVAPALRHLAPDLPQLLQGAAVVTGGGTTGTGVVTGTGVTTGVTTLPAPVTTVMTMPTMMTLAPGIAIGILKALFIGLWLFVDRIIT